MQVAMKWVRSDGATHDRGYMQLNDFQASGSYSANGYASEVYFSAMIYPVVCYASTPRTVTVQLWRSASGPTIWLGRPIAVPVVCSWFGTQ
jgi:hypothetical protein